MASRTKKGPRLTLVWGPRMVNPAMDDDQVLLAWWHQFDSQQLRYDAVRCNAVLHGLCRHHEHQPTFYASSKEIMACLLKGLLQSCESIGMES